MKPEIEEGGSSDNEGKCLRWVSAR